MHAHKEIFGSNTIGQTNFYRKTLLTQLGSIYQHLICDFLYFWLIGKENNPHPILEMPLSYTWIKIPFKYNIAYRRRFEKLYFKQNSPPAGMSTMLNSLFLISGINIDIVMPLCKPSLKEILKDIKNY